MDLRILPVEPDDARALQALLTHPDVADTYGSSPAEPVAVVRRRLEESDPSSMHRLKALLGDRLVGLATLETTPRPRRRHAGTVSVAVHPEVWRSGVGERLLGAVVDAADRWFGLTRLELDVRASNEAAIALYRKLGFVTEATRRMGDANQLGAPLDALYMARLRPGVSLGTPAAAPAVAERGPAVTARIRPLEPDDAPAMAVLHREESVLFGTLQVPTTSVEFWRRRLLENHPAQHRLLAAIVDGQLVGVGGLHGPTNPRYAHVVGLGMTVATAFQGRGVGGQILSALVELADFLALRRVELEVFTDNHRAIRLYRSHGFEEEGTLRGYALRNGAFSDVLLMSRVR